MGLLRFLLAISVVFGHAGPLFGWRMTGGMVAVQAFYMISGFYISMILKDRYVGPDGLRTFYLNRALRIFPSYWIMLVLTWGAAAAGWFALKHYSANVFWNSHSPGFSGTTSLFFGFANLFLFFQDWMLFLRVGDLGELLLNTGFGNNPRPGYLFLVVPQAWTLGVELSFYAIAPWLLKRRTFVLLAVAGASLLVRAALASRGLANDPWSYRFFPNEILFFLVGALLERGLRAKKGLFLPLRFGKAAFAGSIGLTLAFQWIYGEKVETPAWFYYLPIALSLPALFEHTKRLQWDRMIGELSYPIYVSHVFFTQILAAPPPEDFTATGVYSLKVALCTLAASVVLRGINLPIERWREQAALSLREGKPRARRRAKARTA